MPHVHPVRGSKGAEAPAEGGDRGGRPQAQARHHPEQEHRPLQQRDQAPQVIHTMHPNPFKALKCIC